MASSEKSKHIQGTGELSHRTGRAGVLHGNTAVAKSGEQGCGQAPVAGVENNGYIVPSNALGATHRETKNKAAAGTQ